MHTRVLFDDIGGKIYDGELEIADDAWKQQITVCKGNASEGDEGTREDGDGDF